MDNKYKITLISDTHCKHRTIGHDLPGGDILICAGDISSMGYNHEIEDFCKWFDKIVTYDHKIFISGNHDFGFEDNAEAVGQIVNSFKTIDYLQDNLLCVGKEYEDMIKIWGSPWQPEFHNWAFNLPRNGKELEHKWSLIPENTDILITHGPAWGIVDTTEWARGNHLGCEVLAERIRHIKPKIHVCGHIHSGNGHYFDGDTHYFNASVLGERYTYMYKPHNIIWNKTTNEVEFIF